MGRWQTGLCHLLGTQGYHHGSGRLLLPCVDFLQEMPVTVADVRINDSGSGLNMTRSKGNAVKNLSCHQHPLPSFETSVSSTSLDLS